jgi:outer membrane protein assembly factor BamB
VLSALVFSVFARYVSHRNDVYVCMTAGSYDGCVYCISLHTGEVEWSFQTGGLVKSSPALCLNGSAVVVGSYDQFLYCISILVCLVILNKSCRLVLS